MDSETLTLREQYYGMLRLKPQDNDTGGQESYTLTLRGQDVDILSSEN